MDTQHLIDIMNIAEKLKCRTRHSWTSSGRCESVAEHSWRLALLSWFVKDEFPDADLGRVILMCLIHDIGEAYTGDIPSFQKTKAHEEAEDVAVAHFLESLPEPYRGELQTLFSEMSAMKTQEAKIYKALDKLEAVLQHNEADIFTWLPLEYDLQLTYGAAETEFSGYMGRLKNSLNGDTAEKINRNKEPQHDRNQVL